MKNINKQVLNLYLIKLLAISQEKNFDEIIKEKEKKEKNENLKNEKKNRNSSKNKKSNVLNNDHFRGKHFIKKGNEILVFEPKENDNKIKSYLYCCEHKNGCKAKLRIDMKKKICKEIDQHNDHTNLDITYYLNDYPELAEDNWTHMQFDTKNDEKIFMWKK